MKTNGILTLQIDGKIANLLTDTKSYQACPLCQKNQSQFNKKNLNFEILKDYAQFGLSTLHFGINSVKFLLKLASQIDIKVHTCTKTSGNQDKRETQAEINSQLLWNNLSIQTKDWFTVDGINQPITLKYF